MEDGTAVYGVPIALFRQKFVRNQESQISDEHVDDIPIENQNLLTAFKDNHDPYLPRLAIGRNEKLFNADES